MTLSVLRMIAQWHAEQAANCALVTERMGACPAAEEFRANGRRHAEWALQLTDLADAFETFPHVAISES